MRACATGHNAEQYGYAPPPSTDPRTRANIRQAQIRTPRCTCPSLHSAALHALRRTLAPIPTPFMSACVNALRFTPYALRFPRALALALLVLCSREHRSSGGTHITRSRPAVLTPTPFALDRSRSSRWRLDGSNSHHTSHHTLVPNHRSEPPPPCLSRHAARDLRRAYRPVLAHYLLLTTHHSNGPVLPCDSHGTPSFPSTPPGTRAPRHRAVAPSGLFG